MYYRRTKIKVDIKINCFEKHFQLNRGCCFSHADYASLGCPLSQIILTTLKTITFYLVPFDVDGKTVHTSTYVGVLSSI